MRSLFILTALSALALNAIANPIPLAEKLRAEGRSEHDILAQLGARHPTPSLGESDLLTTTLFRRDASPGPAPAVKRPSSKTAAMIESVIYKVLATTRRGLEYAGVVRSAEPEASAYEGMEDLVRKPEYKIRLRA